MRIASSSHSKKIGGYCNFTLIVPNLQNKTKQSENKKKKKKKLVQREKEKEEKEKEREKRRKNLMQF
jgi:hypothetical protein